MTMPPPPNPPVVEPCDEGHAPIGAAEAVILLRSLYAVGVGYHHLADLTRLGLTHVQMREILLLPDLASQAQVLAFFAL